MYDTARIADAAQIKLATCEALPDCSNWSPAIRLARFNLLGDATDDMTAKDGYRRRAGEPKSRLMAQRLKPNLENLL
jgi:hypothetical protein